MNFTRPKYLRDRPTHYCPGCGHGVVHRVIAEVVEELGIRGKTVGIAPVGCAVLAYDYWDFDCSEAAHGRALAVATGIKRSRPDLAVFSYQGDGDLVAIGTAETIHAANRGENLTCIFINNAYNYHKPQRSNKVKKGSEKSFLKSDRQKRFFFGGSSFSVPYRVGA